MQSSMIKTISNTRDIVNTFSSSAVFSMLYMYLCEVTKSLSNTTYIGIFYIFACGFIDYLLRKKSSDFVKYTIARLLFIPVLFLLPFGTGEKIILALYLAILITLSTKYWTSEETTKIMSSIEIPAEIMVLIVPLYIHSYFYLSDSLITFILIFSVIFLSLYFISSFLSRLMTYSMSIPSGSVVPLTDVMKANLSSILIVIGVSVFLIYTICSLTSKDSALLIFILSIFRNIMGLFMGCISRIRGKDSGTYVEPTTEEPSSSFDLTGDISKDLEPNEILAAISNILSTIFLLVFVFFILYVIYNYFKAHMHKDDKDIDIIEDVTVTYSDTKKKSDRKFSFFRSRSNTEKIRRLYKKKVLLYKDTFITIKECDTPKNISDKIKGKTSDDISELTSIYEKARYGKNIIDDNDLKQAKKIASL